MNARRLTTGAIALAAVLTIGGCDEDAEVLMPDVTGKNLEVALSDIARAGINDEVEVIGGGLFGVVDEANWLVCVQEPVAGQAVTAIPRVTVERSCDGDDVSELEDEPAPESPEPAEEPEDEPAPEPTETAVDVPATDEILTIENNEDLKALLTSSADDELSREFASKYMGRTIAFDGYISALAPHEDYKTRFNMMFDVGDGFDGPVRGPGFRLIDVSITGDLNLTGDNIPDNLALEQKVRATLKVVDWDESLGVFRGDPVMTEIRD